MRRWRAADRRIFFPWEGRSGLLRAIAGGRVRPVLLGLLVVGVFVVVGVRERRQAGVRHTRSALLNVRQAVDAYMAEHDGGCPATVAVAVDHAGMKLSGRDAWGRPLRLVCPARHDESAYELYSDGPDGEPGGLDRVQ